MKLVKRSVESAEARDKRYLLWDEQLHGFGLIVHPSGRKSFTVQYRNRSRRTRRMNLGTFGVLTVQQARQRATEALAAVAAGRDPMEEKLESYAAPTVFDLAERYEFEHAVKKKSGDEDVRKLKGDVLPVLGRLKVAAVTMGDVSRLHLGMNERPVAANRVLPPVPG